MAIGIDAQIARERGKKGDDVRLRRDRRNAERSFWEARGVADGARCPGVAIGDDFRALHGPELGKQLLQIGAVDAVAQIPDIQLLAHHTSPVRGRADPFCAFRVEYERDRRVGPTGGKVDRDDGEPIPGTNSVHSLGEPTSPSINVRCSTAKDEPFRV